jgi:hypothetical protein
MTVLWCVRNKYRLEKLMHSIYEYYIVFQTMMLNIKEFLIRYNYTTWFIFFNILIHFVIIFYGNEFLLWLFILSMNFVILYITCVFPLDLERHQILANNGNVRFWAIGIRFFCLYFAVVTTLGFFSYYKKLLSNRNQCVILTDTIK